MGVVHFSYQIISYMDLAHSAIVAKVYPVQTGIKEMLNLRQKGTCLLCSKMIKFGAKRKGENE